MVKDVATNILNLIKENNGLKREDLLNVDIDTQKIIDIILSECRCSFIDSNGNYARFGSSTDIRIIKILIQNFLSDLKEIPPEIVSMALTKESVLGPLKKLEFTKKYDAEKDLYDLELEEIFPKEFYVSIFRENVHLKDTFINEIIKPYVKNIIFDNDALMSKSPIGAYLNKYIITWISPLKTDEELQSDLKEILKKEINADEKLVENISDYIFINIMNNVFFKNELVNRTINSTELQKLGKISIGFNGLVENMSYETLQMIELRSFPYGELVSIKNTFLTITAVLETLCTNLNNLGEDEILKNIEKINRYFCNCDVVKYRKGECKDNKYDGITKSLKPDQIDVSMRNLCRMMKVLLDKKDEIEMQTYLKEVLRIHYRYIRIQPFERGNGRTARAIVNMLLLSKGMVGIFRKEKRNEYNEYISEANKTIKESEEKYINGLVERPMECIELENRFLDMEKIPFLLVKS